MEVYYCSWFEYIMSLTPQLVKPYVEPLIDKIMIEYSKKSVKERDNMYMSMRNSKLDELFKKRIFYVMDIYEAIVEITGKKFSYQECFDNVGRKILVKYSVTRDPENHRKLYKFIKEFGDDFQKGFIDSLLKTMDLYDNMERYKGLLEDERRYFRSYLEKKLSFDDYLRFHICTVILERTVHPSLSVKDSFMVFEYDSNEMARCAAVGEDYNPRSVKTFQHKRDYKDDSFSLGDRGSQFKKEGSTWTWFPKSFQENPNKGLAPRVVQSGYNLPLSGEDCIKGYKSDFVQDVSFEKLSSSDSSSIGNCLLDSDSDDTNLKQDSLLEDKDSLLGDKDSLLEDVWDIL